MRLMRCRIRGEPRKAPKMNNSNNRLARDLISLEGKVWEAIERHGLDVHADGEHVLVVVAGLLLDAQGAIPGVPFTPEPR
jgi:hypothetical protein